MNIIYSICDYRYIILRSVRSQASGRRFTFFYKLLANFPVIGYNPFKDASGYSVSEGGERTGIFYIIF